MSNSIQDQIQEGKTKLQQGNQEQAHNVFLQILKQEPKNIMALLYAGASASGREEAEYYLKQAQALDPDNTSIQKGLQWAQNQPSKPFKKTSLKKPKSKTKNGRLSSGPLDRSALRLLGGLILFGVLLAAGLYAYRIIFAPRNPGEAGPPANAQLAEEQLVPNDTAEPVSTQYEPGALLPTWTPEPTPTLQELPTRTVQPVIPAGQPSISSDGRFTSNLPPLSPDAQDYAIVDAQTLINSPDDFQDHYLQLTLPIMRVSAALIDGNNQYILLLDPGQISGKAIAPIVVFGINNNNEDAFEVGQMLTVFGAGLGQIDFDKYFAIDDHILPEDMYQEGQNRILPAVAGMFYKSP